MKVKQLIKRLQFLEKKYGNLELLYSKDDEGNDYKNVFYDASILYANFEEEDFLDEEYYEEYKKNDEDFDEKYYKKYILIN